MSDNEWLSFFGKLYIWFTSVAVLSGAIALVASNGIRRYSERVGTFQNRQIADANGRAAGADERAGEANKQAGVANKRAGEAHERAAKLEVRASEAEARTRQAEAEAAKANAASHEAVARVAGANARIAEANRAAAEAERVAEAERLERLRLEAQIAPRRLGVEQQHAIATSLSQFAGRRISVTSYALDGEAAVLGRQIEAALDIAHIAIDDRIAGSSPVGGFSLGIHINGAEQDLVAALRSALSSIGALAVAPANAPRGGAFSMDVVPSGPQALPVAEILIGIKPVPRVVQ